MWIIIVISAVSLGLLIVLLLKTQSNEKNRDELNTEFQRNRDEILKMAKDLREEINQLGKNNTDTLINTLSKMGSLQREQLDDVIKQINQLSESNEKRIEKTRETIDERLKELQSNNEKKLEQMRQTVDEKLQSTLEKRLGESFKLVSDNLEAVHKGLGEMKNLASNVGDLKSVLTNVKARGTWGEVQLWAILEQILSPEQYEKNVKPNETTGEIVEYAVKLPGEHNSKDSVVWLPIDAKFPQEDYMRLVEAAEKAEADEVQKASSALLRAVHKSAKDIQEKYINPPNTTDFAIMFLPTEGLYAEILRQPGQVEELQQKYRIVIAGPTTLTAILSSLRMGFRTLAIKKRSSEVWNTLGQVKTEFGKFGDVLTKVKGHLDKAVNSIDETSRRTRAIDRKLREVEELPIDTSKNFSELNDSYKIGDEADEV